MQQNFPVFNRLSFCCSLKTFVNNQEGQEVIKELLPLENFPFIYQQFLYLNPLGSVTQFPRLIIINAFMCQNKLYRVINRRITTSILISNRLFKLLHFMEH